MQILRDRDDEVRDREGIVRTPSRDRAGSCGDRTHLQKLVCGIVRGSYRCRMPLCGIVMWLSVLLCGIAWDREGILSTPSRNRVGIVPVCKGWNVESRGDRILVGGRFAGS